MNGWFVTFPELSGGTSISVGLAAALILVLCLAIYRNRNPRHRWLRMGLTVLAFAALCGFVFKPQWRVTQTSQTAVLLTTGYDARELSAFLALHPQKPAAFAMNGVKASADITPIPDLAWLHRNQPQITELHVFGFGLDPWDLQALKGLHLVPHFSTPTLGIEQIHWQRELPLGATLQIEGSLSQANTLNCSLILEDPGGHQWALSPDRNDRNFRFVTNPKAPGRHEYKLTLKDAEGSPIQMERLPVWVTENEPPKLLMLGSSPSFEARFLKSWLARGNGSVLIRTRISEDRYLWSGTDSNNLEFTSLSKKVLQGFDLVILDDTVLKDLKPEETTVLSAAIEAGLGLLLVPPNRITPHKTMTLLQDFTLKSVADLETREVAAIFTASTGSGDPVEAEPFEIEDQGILQPLVWDRSQRVLAAMTPRGSGAIGLSLIANSYTWVMKQTPQEHAAYWTHLIQALSRRQPLTGKWSTADPWPRVHQPFSLRLATTDPGPVAKIENSVQISLRQDAREPSHWSATWWPREPGWHRLNHSSSGDHWIWVFGEGEWQSVQRALRIQATRAAAGERHSPTATTSATTWKYRPISQWLFFVLFLITAGGLWLEHKGFTPE